MGWKRRASQASPPSDAVQCRAGFHPQASLAPTPRVRSSPTGFSEFQTQQPVEILLIAGERRAQLALELRVALAAELRAVLRDGGFVERDLADDEVGRGARLARH